MNTYYKEVKKMIILLVIGVILCIGTIIGTIKNVGDITFDLETLGILLCVILYPLGVFYGWREMLNLFRNIRSADRMPANVGSITVAITMMNISIAFAVTLTFGWLFGIYKVLKILVKAKTHTV